MTQSSTLAIVLATLITADLQAKLNELEDLGKDLSLKINLLVVNFLLNRPTPESFLDTETQLRTLIDEFARLVLQSTVNSVEPESPADAPKHTQLDGHEFSRKNEKTPNRQGIASTFGTIYLNRISYEPLSDAKKAEHKSFSPLEWNLGIVAGNATPALAQRIGLLASDQSQQELLDTLERDHHVKWSVDTLRKVTQAVSSGLQAHLHQARRDLLLGWLKEANESKGKRKIVVSVGRDGIMMRIRGEKQHKEAAVATISIFDRQGKRLGTVYLAAMPESGQGQMTDELTELIKAVIKNWKGPMPRLAYVTDAGHHPEAYYDEVLKKMEDPQHPGKKLQWVRIVDYYHAAGYISKLAAVLFENEKEKQAWAHRMRHLLLEKKNGWRRLLWSAAYYRGQQKLSKTQEKEYQEAYGYLSRHSWGMNYSQYRQLGLPVGSGITEAGCKIVFTQRFKRSGMKWKHEGGKAILNIRCAVLSGIYETTFRHSLAGRQRVNMATRYAGTGDPKNPIG